MLGGLVVALVWVLLDASMPAPDALRDLLATSMSLAAITVGFLATAMSVVIAAPDSPIVRQLAVSGYLKDVIRYLKEPFLAGLTVASVCLLGFILPTKATNAVCYGALWSALCTWMILGLFRVGGIFVQVIELIGQLGSKPKPQE